FHEGLPNQLGIRISEVVAGDLPHFREGSPESVADCVEARAPACYECRRRCSGIDFPCRRKKFHCRVVNDAVAVSDVSKDSRHYFSPPLAAMSSSTLSMFSSRLPESISAPLPSAGMKESTRVTLAPTLPTEPGATANSAASGVAIGTDATARMPRMPT